jgi:hypothetical protein
MTYKGFEIYTHRYTDGGFFAAVYNRLTDDRFEVNTPPSWLTGTKFGFETRSQAISAAKKRINERQRNKTR